MEKKSVVVRWQRRGAGRTFVAPEEGAESGEQPEESPNRLAMKTGPERPNV